MIEFDVVFEFDIMEVEGECTGRVAAKGGWGESCGTGGDGGEGNPDGGDVATDGAG